MTRRILDAASTHDSSIIDDTSGGTKASSYGSDDVDDAPSGGRFCFPEEEWEAEANSRNSEMAEAEEARESGDANVVDDDHDDDRDDDGRRTTSADAWGERDDDATMIAITMNDVMTVVVLGGPTTSREDDDDGIMASFRYDDDDDDDDAVVGCFFMLLNWIGGRRCVAMTHKKTYLEYAPRGVKKKWREGGMAPISLSARLVDVLSNILDVRASADTMLGLVVEYSHRVAASQYWRSAHLSFFYGAILTPQNKGIGCIVRARGRRAPAVDS